MSKFDFESQKEIWSYLASGGRVKLYGCCDYQFGFGSDDTLCIFTNGSSNSFKQTDRRFIDFKNYLKVQIDEIENKTEEPETQAPTKLKLYKFAYLSRSMKVWSETRNFYHSIAHVLERLKELEGDEADAIIKLEIPSIEVTI